MTVKIATTTSMTASLDRAQPKASVPTLGQISTCAHVKKDGAAKTVLMTFWTIADHGRARTVSVPTWAIVTAVIVPKAGKAQTVMKT